MIIPVNVEKQPDGSYKGHVVTGTGDEVEKIIITAKADEATQTVATHIDAIVEVYNNLIPIVQSWFLLQDIPSITLLGDRIYQVNAYKEDIKAVANDIDAVKTVAANTKLLPKLIDNLSDVKKVAESVDEVKLVWALRKYVKTLGSMSTELKSLDSNIDIYKGVLAIDEEIKLCYEHMLAIEEVAQNSEQLKLFTENIDVFKALEYFGPSIEVFAENIELAVNLERYYNSLDNEIERFTRNLSYRSNELKEDFQKEAKKAMDDFDDKLATWERLSMQMNRDVLDAQKQIAELKVKVVENETTNTAKDTVIDNSLAIMRDDIDDNTADITNTINTLKALDLYVQKLAKQISSKDTNVANKISNLNSSVSNIETSLQAKLDVLSHHINDVNVKVEANTADITNVMNNIRYMDVENAVSEFKTTLNDQAVLKTDLIKLLKEAIQDVKDNNSKENNELFNLIRDIASSKAR